MCSALRQGCWGPRPHGFRVPGLCPSEPPSGRGADFRRLCVPRSSKLPVRAAAPSVGSRSVLGRGSVHRARAAVPREGGGTRGRGRRCLGLQPAVASGEGGTPRGAVAPRQSAGSSRRAREAAPGPAAAETGPQVAGSPHVLEACALLGQQTRCPGPAPSGGSGTRSVSCPSPLTASSAGSPELPEQGPGAQRSSPPGTQREQLSVTRSSPWRQRFRVCRGPGRERRPRGVAAQGVTGQRRGHRSRRMDAGGGAAGGAPGHTPCRPRGHLPGAGTGRRSLGPPPAPVPVRPTRAAASVQGRPGWRILQLKAGVGDASVW